MASAEQTAATALFAVAVVVVFLVAMVADSGIWDPHELRRAELARRIAIHVFGADNLVVDASADVMPTLSDLGSGELPFTSMALGFRLWGLHDWAGRLPLALWGCLGALALYAFLARYQSARAGLYAVIALVTMPLYFMQARTMIGGVVTMAAFGLAFFGGLGVLVEPRSRWVRRGWQGAMAVGLVSGFLSCGVLFGVAAPATAVGLAWLVLRVGAVPGAERDLADGATIFAWTSLGVGLVAASLGVDHLLEIGWHQQTVSRLLGFSVLDAPEVSSTFDRTVRDLGHALFPWSAFLPFAFGRLAWLPGDEGGGRRGERAVRVGLVVGPAVAFVVHAGAAPFSGSLPFVATPLLAAVIGITLADFERGAPSSGLVGFGTAALGIVLLHDLRTMPAKSLAPLHLGSGALPAASQNASSSLVVAGGLFLAIFWLTWLDPPQLLAPTEPRGREATQAAKAWFRRRIEHYEATARHLAHLWDGNLAFGFLVVEAGLVGVGAMLVIGQRYGWASVVAMPRPLAWAGLNLWWILPLALVFTPPLIDAVRGSFALVLGRLGLPRAFGLALAGLGAGAVLCFGHYADLARRLSPKGVLAIYAERHRAGDPLGVLGLEATSSRYYAQGSPTRELPTTRTAVRWLIAGRAVEPPERRWLIFRAEELPELNALFRQSEGVNLPVIGDASTDLLLASSHLEGERNDNPLSPYVRAAPPSSIQHPVEASLSDRVQSLGWEIRDEDGRLVELVVPGRRYRVTIFYRVLASLPRDYRAFIHIDGEGRRHNGDHAFVYPTSLWRPGDVIVDAHDFVLEPNFTPADYRVYYGFYVGKQRLPVTEGPHRDDRVVGGTLPVR